MNLKSELSKRISKEKIEEILSYIQEKEQSRKELYHLIYDDDKIISFQALWACSHLSPPENQWLCNKQNDLIDQLLACQHSGKRRLLLSILYQQPFSESFRTDLLDFCLDGITSPKELPAAQSLCMKIAYKLCLPIPELLQELRSILEMMEPDLLAPAARSVRRNILKAMQKKKKRSK
ncbi:hypothetical protein [uncultured Bacteroides sp.]|uniref:hypothetical protein n=1 Tax=uncultured Bacteroides sp. TaxID=162156 RepID=UPI002AAC2E00|nr:hypothetical protein [uncultured Bacteroides sp.]